jgi:uncharacterized protein YbaP (TraB family)
LQRSARACLLVLFGFITTGAASAQEATPPDRGSAMRGDGSSPDPAVAQAVQCGGTDLVQALRQSDPASFDKFESDARSVANGQGLLWRVERQGKVSYLFGTMHSSEASAKSFDALVIRALKRAKLVATELPGASSRRVAGELRRLVASRSFRPGGHSLSLLPDDIRPEVQRRLAVSGIPSNVADQLEPWYLAIVLSRSNCASPPGPGVDTETADGRIERLALEQGSVLMALETPVEQVEALSSISDHVALRMIRDAAVKGLKPEDVESTITGLYSTRRIGYLLAMRGPIWAGLFDVDGYADFISAFITRRNASMLRRALPILSAGEGFLAVGALHLPGEQGLVELIRREGFAVTRIW